MILFPLVLLLVFLLAGLFWLAMIGEYRRNSPFIKRVLWDWAAYFGTEIQKQKGKEGRIERFSAVRRDISFSCEYVASYEKGGTRPRFTVSIATKVPAELEIIRERWIHRLCKKIGLDREIQTHDEFFDRNFYLQTGDFSFYRSQFSRKSLRILVNEFFLPEISGKELDIKDDSIRLTIKPITPRRISSLRIDRVVDLLSSLAKALSSFPVEEIKLGSESFRPMPVIELEKRSNILNFVFAVILTGIGLLLRVLGMGNVFGIDDRIWTYSILLTLLIVLFIFLVGYVVLRGTSYSHKLVFGFITAYIMASFSFSIGAISFFNCALDHSQAMYSFSHVVYKEEGRRGNLYLIVSQDGGNTQEKLNVSEAFYRRVLEGAKVIIGRKAGRLGLPWVNDVRLPESNSNSPSPHPALGGNGASGDGKG